MQWHPGCRSCGQSLGPLNTDLTVIGLVDSHTMTCHNSIHARITSKSSDLSRMTSASVKLSALSGIWSFITVATPMQRMSVPFTVATQVVWLVQEEYADA